MKATVTSANVYKVPYKVHRIALITFDYKVPGVSSTTVLTAGLPRILVSQTTNSDGEGLETSSESTIVRRSCKPTDGSDSAGGGSDEGVGVPAQIAARDGGEASMSHLPVTSVLAHLPDMPISKLCVTILREDGSRKQQQTSKHDLHDSLVERMWGKCSVSEVAVA